MSFRFAQHSASQLARISARRATNTGARVSRRYASTSGGHQQGSDLPWIIGSAAVFGPAMLYLLSPSSKKDAHHVAHAHGIDKAEKDRKPNIAPAPVVTKDDEGTEVSEAEVRDSFKKSYNEDSPQDAEAAEVTNASEPPADGEGNTISVEEAKDSIAHAIVDSPKEAQAAEETGSKFEGGSPGQDEASHADVEQKQKPTYTTSGPSFGQTKPPTDMGDMRSQTTEGTASGQTGHASGEREH